jgi:hypothetical protein
MEAMEKKIEGAPRGAAGAVTKDVNDLFFGTNQLFPVHLFGEIVRSLALMGFAVLQHVYAPSKDDPTLLRPKTTIWPTAYTQKTALNGGFEIMTTEGLIPIQSGDGHWTIIGHGENPHLNGAVRALGLEFMKAGFAERDRNNYSAMHGIPKPLGFMPPDMAVGSPEGEAFAETVQNLSEPGSGGAFMNGSDVKMLEASADTSRVFSDIVASSRSNIACALLGTDGTLNKGTGGVYTAPVYEGVVTWIIRSDVTCTETGINYGLIAPYTALNYGNVPAPKLVIPLPDWDRDARTKSYADRLKAFHEIVGRERQNGFRVSEERVRQLARSLEIEPPELIPA